MKKQMLGLLFALILSGCGAMRPFSLAADPPLYPELEALQMTATAAAFSAPTATENRQPSGSPGSSADNPAAIRITEVTDSARGEALVRWEASGEFPSGFKIAYSDRNPNPTFPEDNWVYVSDPDARAGRITGSPGQIYAIRVCRYTGSICDVYTDPVYFTFSKNTPPSSSSETLAILSITELGSGKVRLTWMAEGKFPYGFKIVWSDKKTAPTYPEDAWIYISDPAARSAEITAAAGKTYTFRICKFDGSGCTLYSAGFAFTLSGKLPTASVESIRILEITAKSSGKAVLRWEAVGSFPQGFKVAYSKTSKNPSYPEDTWVYLSDPNARSAVVEGDPGAQYYFRVCKYTGSACAFYSAASTYTFPSLPTESPVSINITDISNTTAGKAVIRWSATGSFPNGFKVVWSAVNPNPTYPEDTWIYVSNADARSAVVEGTPGTRYTFRVCKYLGGSCGTYSPGYSFTFAPAATEPPPPEPTADTSTINITSVSASSADTAVVSWSASGSFPQGFKIVWSDSLTSPTYPGSNSTLINDPGASSGSISGLESGKTYYVRVCKFDGSSCVLYSGTQTYSHP